MPEPRIKLMVTREQFNKVMDIDTGFYLLDCTDKEVYDKMLEFVVDDEGKYVGRDRARKLFKNVPRGELGSYIREFVKGIGDAFVNPTNDGS